MRLHAGMPNLQGETITHERPHKIESSTNKDDQNYGYKHNDHEICAQNEETQAINSGLNVLPAIKFQHFNKIPPVQPTAPNDHPTINANGCEITQQMRLHACKSNLQGETVTHGKYHRIESAQTKTTRIMATNPTNMRYVHRIKKPRQLIMVKMFSLQSNFNMSSR